MRDAISDQVLAIAATILPGLVAKARVTQAIVVRMQEGAVEDYDQQFMASLIADTLAMGEGA